MSRVFFSEIGPYKLRVEDDTGQAADLGKVRASPVTPSFGELRRTRGSGVYPCQFSILVDDPRDTLKDLLTGALTEDDFTAKLTGPSGPTGENFELWFLPKKNVRQDPISNRRFPDGTRLTFYDGLRRLKDATNSFETIGLIDFQTLLNDSFSEANSDLGRFASLTHEHQLQGLQDKDNAGANELSKIEFFTRTTEAWKTYWDALIEVAQRYNLTIAQSAYYNTEQSGGSLPGRGTPMFCAIPSGKVGLSVTGRNLINGNTRTLDENKLRVRQNDLSQNGGREYQSAAVFEVVEELGADPKEAEPEPLVINQNDAIRAGESDFGAPQSYAKTQNVSEEKRGSFQDSGDIQYRLDPNDNNTEDAFYKTNRFHVGVGPKFFRLKYHLELQKGSEPSAGVNVKLAIEDESGTDIKSTTGGSTGASFSTLDLDTTSYGLVYVELICPFDSGNDYAYDFAIDHVETFQSSDARNGIRSQDFPSVQYRTGQRGTFSVSIGPLTDMRINVDQDASLYPTERYKNTQTGDEAWTAGEMVYRDLKALRPSGTQTLRSILDDKIGPYTRVLVEDDGGTVQRRLIMHGGRKMHLKDVYTTLADIEVPTF